MAGFFAFSFYFDMASTYYAICVEDFMEMNLAAVDVIQRFGFGFLPSVMAFVFAGFVWGGNAFFGGAAPTWIKNVILGLLVGIAVVPSLTVANNSLQIYGEDSPSVDAVRSHVEDVVVGKAMVINSHEGSYEEYVQKLDSAFVREDFCRAFNIGVAG